MPVTAAATRRSLRNNLGKVLELQGRLEEVEPLYREALDALRRTLGERHRDTIATMGNLGDLYTRQGRLDTGEPRAVAAARSSLPSDDVIRGLTLYKYGRCLAARSRYADAETRVVRGRMGVARSTPPRSVPRPPASGWPGSGRSAPRGSRLHPATRSPG